MRILLAVSSVLLLGLLIGNAWADTFTLRSGEVVTGQVDSLIGDLLTYREGMGQTNSLKRWDLINHQDRITLRNSKPDILGNIFYIDAQSVDIQTDVGRKRIRRFKIREIHMGSAPNSSRL